MADKDERKSLLRKPALILEDVIIPPPTLLFPGLTTLEHDSNANNQDIIGQSHNTISKAIPPRRTEKDNAIDRLTRLIELSVGPQSSRRQSPDTDVRSSTITTESASFQHSRQSSIIEQSLEHQNRGRTHLPTSRRHRQHHTLPRNIPPPEYTILARPREDIGSETGPGTNDIISGLTPLPTTRHHEQRQINSRNLRTQFSIRNRHPSHTQTHSVDGESTTHSSQDTPRRNYIPSHRSNPQLRVAVQNARTSTAITYFASHTNTNSSPGPTSVQTQRPSSQTPSSNQQFPAGRSPSTNTDHTYIRLERSNTWNGGAGGANQFASVIRSKQVHTDHSFAMERWIKGNDRQGNYQRYDMVMEQELAFPSWNEVQLPTGPLTQDQILAIERGLVQVGSWIDEVKMRNCGRDEFGEVVFMNEDCTDLIQERIL